MERNVECSRCGQTFRVTGYSSYVRCPYCRANLQIGEPSAHKKGFHTECDGSCGSNGRVTDYYDSDVEGFSPPETGEAKKGV